MYMVKSTLVVLACLMNGVLLTGFMLLNICDKGTPPGMLSLVMYFGGLIFNTFVVLYAHRKLQLISKKAKNYLVKYLMSLSKEIEELQNKMDYFQRLFSMDRCWRTARTIYPDITRTVGQSSRVRHAGHEENSNQETSQELKTPDVNCPSDKLCTRSDPVKKPMKLRISRRSLGVQSPELFKNKIYKSRMNLADGLNKKE